MIQMEPTTLQVIWFFLIGVLLAGYSVLDGFDLGVGILFPFLARREEDKQALIKAIGPFWDGNEVWLLAGGAALFAAFPPAYATVFSGFYLALMIVLVALILRAVSFEFRSHDLKRQKFWEGAFFVGSFLPALLFGVALGNVLQGIPLDAGGDFRGSFFTLLRPFPLACGLLGLSSFLLHGTTYIILKTEGGLKARAKRLAGGLWWVEAGLFLHSLVMSFIYLPQAKSHFLAWVAAAIFIISLAVLNLGLAGDKDRLAFLATALSLLSLWGIVGAVQYPVLVRASDPALSLTAANASSSPLTLRVMLIIALIGLPIVIAAFVFLYKVFKGRVKPGRAGY
jgi:cytochrome d ubiquinol oxidase subunit II